MPALHPVREGPESLAPTYLGIVVEVEVRVSAVLLKEEELLLPFPDLLLLLQQVALHLDALLPLRVSLWS